MKRILSSSFLLIIGQLGISQTTLIPFGAVGWKYLDNGTNQGTAGQVMDLPATIPGKPVMPLWVTVQRLQPQQLSALEPVRKRNTSLPISGKRSQ
jgi:hypothetical protein